MSVVLLDNYDSFTYNIVYQLKTLGTQPIILYNDCTLQDIQKVSPTHLLISPGPSSPKDSGICIEAILHFAKYIHSD